MSVCKIWQENVKRGRNKSSGRAKARFFVAESRSSGTVDGVKNPHAKTEAGDSSVDAGNRIFWIPRK